jgi:PAS domain-containing protein
VTLREEHRLRVFENRVARRIFGLKRDEVTGGLRKLLDEELHNFKSRKMRWAWHVVRKGRRGMFIVSLWESQKERGHYEDLDAGG